MTKDLHKFEAKGTADPVTEAKLSKIEKDMDKFADFGSKS